jgi:hypothetical protein
MPDDPFEAEDFPEDLYLAAFGDVREAVHAGAFASGYEHYIGFGRAEIAAGIRPSPFEPGPPGLERSILPAADDDEPVPPSPPPMTLAAYEGAIRYTPPPPSPFATRTEADMFNEALYLALNPDVAEAVAQGVFPDGRSHWLAAGRAEAEQGMRPSITADALYAGMPAPGADAAVDASNFDAESYFLLYPDVRQAMGSSPEAALHHWVHHGRFEGRVGAGVAPYGAWRARAAEVLAKPFGINVFGPFAATSGLGTAARGLLAALQSIGVQIELHPFDVSRALPRITRA